METPDTREPEETQGQLRGLGAALRGLARCLGSVTAGPGPDAFLLEAVLERARQDLLSTAWRLERRAAGLPTVPEPGEPHPREEGWPPVRFASDFDTAAAMRAELRAYGAVLGESGGALRDLEARLGRRSLLVEEEPGPELGEAVAEAASRVEAAARACR